MMHIQHLAVRLDVLCRTLLGVVRLLEDGKGINGAPLFEIHVRIHGGSNVDEGAVYGVLNAFRLGSDWRELRTVKTKG
jgi:hypothetical protein